MLQRSIGRVWPDERRDRDRDAATGAGYSLDEALDEALAGAQLARS
jgi:hypothetical protein